VSLSPLDFLFGLERLGMKLGLENMRTLCAALDHPEQRFKSVIVAGTNGKGSVTAMLSASLHAGGYRAGRYTSPHLERLEERFVIGEREVDSRALIESASHVQDTVVRLLEAGALDAPPTFFECATAIAFELFARAEVTVAVLEVGLGGRLDATNVVTPIAAAITSIDLDHQAQLGSTIESIAREKAGVIKPGIPVVCGRLPAEAERVIATRCRELSASIVRAGENARWSSRIADGTTLLTIATSKYTLVDVPLALRGRHQADNAAVAVCLAERISRRAISLDATAVRRGLTSAAWPGRLERFSWCGAELLLDAAHNPAGARALASYLRETGWIDGTLVLGVMRDKDVEGMLEALVPVSGPIICTTPPNPRALPAAELTEIARRAGGVRKSVTAIDDPQEAVRLAANPGARLVVAGSVFLIGAVRGILR
jgi:dihydrofolate synthase/folylpolyglutamate synthase